MDEADHPDTEAVIDPEHAYAPLDDVCALYAQHRSDLFLLIRLNDLGVAGDGLDELRVLALGIECLDHLHGSAKGIGWRWVALAAYGEDLEIDAALFKAWEVDVVEFRLLSEACLAPVPPYAVT